MHPSTRRKLIYLALAAALLLPLAWLGQPATRGGGRGQPGGHLAQQREHYRLGQSNLGKIDPASETIKLATLGLRGVASTILWNKADDYKMKKDWTRLSAAYQQIAYLQPNFVAVWRNQTWNLSYNIAAEWDDYRQRYQYVIRGLDFLEVGREYNENDPRLLMETGWFAIHRLGRSDERLLFRKMFHDDDDFHHRQAVHERDNFLFGKEYYKLAERSVEQPSNDPRVVQVSLSPPLFYSRTTMAQVYYAAALEDDHLQAIQTVADRGPAPGARREAWHEYEARFGEIDRDMTARILAGWQQADRDWRAFGQREFIAGSGIHFRLEELERVQKERDAAAAKLDAIVGPELRETLKQEKYAALSAEERRAYDTPAAERTSEQQGYAGLADSKMDVTYLELGNRVTGPQAAEAKRLAEEAARINVRVDTIKSNREVVNFDYWRSRINLEQTTDARQARLDVHRATVAFNEADLVRAHTLFEQSFQHWRKVLDANAFLADDPTGLLMIDAIHRYEHLLKLMDLPFPKVFLLDILRNSPMAK
ncbi:MAG: hypothetical protein JSS27_10410 [Planctomycetes bacterium]|nr:hypothetical protein [Planctomycetota bacterium]